MMRDLYNVLPDDRPITSICVVEDPNRRPPGYHVVHRTYDQDTDADLWKEGFFGKKITRYLCHTKTEIQVSYIVDSITVINDKDLPPDGFTALTHTSDTEQKATKKRVICYRSLPRDRASQAITDVIILSKTKKAPAGFTLAGDMNGHLICYKVTSVTKNGQNPAVPIYNSTGPGSSASPVRNSTSAPTQHVSTPTQQQQQQLPYSVTPLVSSTTSGAAPPPPRGPALYPVDQLQHVSNAVQPNALQRNMTLPRNLEYGRTWHPTPSNAYAAAGRMPPLPPPVNQLPPSSQSSLGRGGQSKQSGSSAPYGLDGVVFEVNHKFRELKNISSFVIPNLERKTIEQLDSEYNYDFGVEQQTLQRLPRSSAK